MKTMGMTKTARRRALVTMVVTLVSAAGCELAVDFDRTKVDSGSVDASIPEGGLPDTIAPVGDATPDALDASGDAPTDDADAATPPDGALEDAADAGDDAADAALE